MEVNHNPVVALQAEISEFTISNLVRNQDLIYEILIKSGKPCRFLYID